MYVLVSRKANVFRKNETKMDCRAEEEIVSRIQQLMEERQLLQDGISLINKKLNNLNIELDTLREIKENGI